MEVTKYMAGGDWYRFKHQVAQTFSNAGVPALVGTEAEAGVDLATTTGAADMIGVTMDTATYVTAQQSDWPTNTAERLITIDGRPDAIIRALLTGGSGDGTALTLYDVTTATSDGLSVVTGDDFTSPEYDDGTCWFFDGVNIGQIRKITSTGATSVTVTVAFENDHQVGDNLIVVPFAVFDDQSASVTLNTNLTQVDCSVAVSTSAAEFHPIEIEAGTINNEGRTNSYVYMVSASHWLNYPT